MEVRIDGRDGGGRRDGNTHRDHDREAREVGRSDLTGARARFRDGAMFARWEGVGAHRVRLRFRGVARGFAEAAEPLGGEGRGVAWRGGWRARGVASGESGGGRIVSGSGARARRGYRVAGREVDRGGGGEGARGERSVRVAHAPDPPPGRSERFASALVAPFACKAPVERCVWAEGGCDSALGPVRERRARGDAARRAIREGSAPTRSSASGRDSRRDGRAPPGASEPIMLTVMRSREFPVSRVRSRKRETVWCGARGGACEDAKSAEREGERAKSEGASPRPARVSNPGSSLDLRASRSAERRRSAGPIVGSRTASPRSPACARNRSPRADDERGTLCVSPQRRASPPHSRARTRRDATIADHARRSTSRDASRA